MCLASMFTMRNAGTYSFAVYHCGILKIAEVMVSAFCKTVDLNLVVKATDKYHYRPFLVSF